MEKNLFSEFLEKNEENPGILKNRTDLERLTKSGGGFHKPFIQTGFFLIKRKG